MASNSPTLLAKTIKQIEETYQITHEQNLKYYLGMHIIRDRENRTITLLQDGYIQELLDTYSISPESFPSSPMIASTNKRDSSSAPLSQSQHQLYRSKVGSLLYLSTQTRPAIRFAVSSAARRSKAPLACDMVAVDQIAQWRRHSPICSC